MKVSHVMTFLFTYLLILLAVFLLQRKMMYFPVRFTHEQQEEQVASLNLQPWPSANELQGMISRIPPIDTKGHGFLIKKAKNHGTIQAPNYGGKI